MCFTSLVGEMFTNHKNPIFCAGVNRALVLLLLKYLYQEFTICPKTIAKYFLLL